MLCHVKLVCAKGETRKALKCVGKLKFNERKKIINIFISISILLYFGCNKQFTEETIEDLTTLKSNKDNRILKSSDSNMGEDNLGEIILNIEEGEDSILFQSFERDLLRFRNDSLNLPVNRTPSETKLLLEAFLNLKFDNLNAFDSSKFDTTYFDIDFFDETLLDGNDIIAQYENLSSFFSDEVLEIKFIDIIGDGAEGESFTFKIVTNKGWLRQLGWKTELGTFNRGFVGFGPLETLNLGTAISYKINSLQQFSRFNTNIFYYDMSLSKIYSGDVETENPLTGSGCCGKAGYIWNDSHNNWVSKNNANDFLSKGYFLTNTIILDYLTVYPKDFIHHIIFWPGNVGGSGNYIGKCGTSTTFFGNYDHILYIHRVSGSSYIPGII